MYASDEGLGELERKDISFMQNDAKGKSETMKNENHLQVHNPFSYPSQPHFLVSGEERKALFCLPGDDC